MSNSKLLLKAENLQVHFPVGGSWLLGKPKQQVKAVDGIDIEVYAGETLGIVGESGCGKSTLARALLRLIEPTGGSLQWCGDDMLAFDKKQLINQRRNFQMIFQDPAACLNPRMTVAECIAEPLYTHEPQLGKKEVEKQVIEMMNRVGLSASHRNRYPHEFSGGQCQRVGIARALILKPKLIICDEPVSALDVSIQAQVINLLKDVQKEMNLALVMIAHDLSVVRHISDRVMVMYLGKQMESGHYQAVFDRATHPYTKALLSAVPIADPVLSRNRDVQLLLGDLPSPIHPPCGCVFRTRCPQASDTCKQQPPLMTGSIKHQVFCNHAHI